MRILIVTKNWLGDMLFQIPAIEAIKAKWPQAEIVCAAPARCRPMLAAHPAVTRFMVLDERGEHRGLLARLRWVMALRREKWDQAWLFHGSRTRAFLVWLAGVKERIGYRSDRSWLLTRSVSEPQGARHEVDHFMDLLRGAGVPVKDDARYRFYFSDKDAETAEELIISNGLRRGGYVCFHLGANWGPKRWPVENFAETARLISKRWQAPVVITGGKDDVPLARTLQSQCRDENIVSFAGKTSLGVLGALFKNAAAVVSADSGPMHIASGVGAPVAALFGPTDPSRTGPRGIGPSVVLQHIPEGFHVPWTGERMPEGGWMSHIQPAEVIRALEEKKWIPGAAAGSQRGRP